MKKKIHPDVHQTSITCACGSSFETTSTQTDLHVEICSACHPFYTGKQKLVDTARRVEKYQEKMKKAKVLKSAAGTKKKTKRSKISEKPGATTLHSNRLDTH